MSLLYAVLLAIALAATFFGKSIIGITLGVMVLLSLYSLFRERNTVFQVERYRNFFISREIFTLTLMCVCWLISSAYFSADVELSLKNWAETVALIIGGLIIYVAVNIIKPDIRMMAICCVSIAGFCSLLMVIAPLIKDIAVINWGSSYGSVLAVLFPFAAMLAYAEDGRKTILWWLMIFILTCGIFASGGRTAWVALGAVIAVFPFLFPWKGIGRPIIKSIFVLVLIAGGAYVGLTSYKWNVGEAVFEARTEAMTSMERPASGRLTVWKNSLPYIIDNLWFGVGIKGVKALQIEKAENEYVSHMHNAVLEFMLETGLIGLLAFIFVIAAFLLSFITAYRSSDNIRVKRYAMAVLMACIAYGVASLALTSMFHAWWFLYLVTLLILLKLTERQLRAQ